MIYLVITGMLQLTITLYLIRKQIVEKIPYYLYFNVVDVISLTILLMFSAIPFVGLLVALPFIIGEIGIDVIKNWFSKETFWKIVRKIFVIGE